MSLTILRLGGGGEIQTTIRGEIHTIADKSNSSSAYGVVNRVDFQIISAHQHQTKRNFEPGDDPGTLRMAARAKTESKAEQMLGRVLSQAFTGFASQIAAWRKPEADIRKLVQHDYVRSVRSNLNYRQLKELIKAFTEIFPDFNRRPIDKMSIERFAEMAGAIGFHFNASPYNGKDGLALRGFYVTPKKGMLKRPLIYVNTAHHPLAISTTFCHELGHHLSARLFERSSQPIHFFFDADYASHLDETSELAADAAVSFAGYPEPTARKIFEASWDWGLVARAKNLTEAALNEVRRHLRRVYGFDLMERIPADRRLHYLCGMIHYAKLRWALLAEYDL